MRTFVLKALPYAYDALQPVISERTLHFHHGKHHQGYIDHLNKLLPGSPFEGYSLEDIVRRADGPLFDHAAQCWNHDFYWKSMSPMSTSGHPGGNFLQALERNFNTIEGFEAEFKAKGETFFGSGWLWLVSNSKGRLSLVTTRDAHSPMKKELTPILVCDLWEHSYYLDHQNLRANYLKGFLDIVNWTFAQTGYDRVIKASGSDSMKSKTRLAS